VQKELKDYRYRYNWQYPR